MALPALRKLSTSFPSSFFNWASILVMVSSASLNLSVISVKRFVLLSSRSIIFILASYISLFSGTFGSAFTTIMVESVSLPDVITNLYVPGKTVTPLGSGEPGFGFGEPG